MEDGREDRSASGYRVRVGGGPAFRADVVDVYVFREVEGGVEFLQLLRAGKPMAATWQPVMGHIEEGERAVETAVRELREEIGLDAREEGGECGCLGLWQLEQVYPYYLADLDAIVCSPRFAAEVGGAFEPVLNDEHTGFRWTERDGDFMWPGQRLALDEVRSAIVPRDSASREGLRIRV